MSKSGFPRRRGDLVFDTVVMIGITVAFVVTLYPFLYVLSMSFSDPEAVLEADVFLLPRGLSLYSYSKVFADPVIYRSLFNSLWYTGVGTACNVVFTILLAYPLSRKRFFLRNVATFLVVFTMLFHGGMIPTFLVVTNLGLYGSRWAMVLPDLVAVWNLIICRTYFQSLSEELFEAARMEGASEWRIALRIVIPLSAPIIAVLVLFYAVDHWNEFLPALLYLPEKDLHPLQIYLRRVLIQSSPDTLDTLVIPDGEAADQAIMHLLQIRYAVIVVAITPIILLYPFLQRYFVKGVMIGALKG